MKHLNGYLVLGGFENCGLVNMFTAVYGGYIVPFGRIFVATDFDVPMRFSIKIGQMLVQGVQLGWMSLGGSYGVFDQLTSPEYANEVAYIQTAAQYRTLGISFLTQKNSLLKLRNGSCMVV